MILTFTQQEGHTLAQLSGRIGMQETTEFEQQMQPLLTGENPDIEIDCSNLSYISSSGLRLLFTLQKSVNDRHGKLVLTNMQEGVRRVFSMTGFSKIISVR